MHIYAGIPVNLKISLVWSFSSFKTVDVVSFMDSLDGKSASFQLPMLVIQSQLDGLEHFHLVEPDELLKLWFWLSTTYFLTFMMQWARNAMMTNRLKSRTIDLGAVSQLLLGSCLGLWKVLLGTGDVYWQYCLIALNVCASDLFD